MARTLATIALFVQLVMAQQTAPAPPAPPPAKGPEPIPLSQIALRSEELGRTLRDISRRLPTDAEIDSFSTQLQDEEQDLGLEVQKTADTLAAGATILELREQTRQLRGY